MFVAGVLDEMIYAFDVIGADGISMSSSYGEGAASSELNALTEHSDHLENSNRLCRG